MHLASHYLPGPRTGQLWTGFAQRMPPSRLSCIRRLLATTVTACAEPEVSRGYAQNFGRELPQHVKQGLQGFYCDIF
jgi:hypothetical protein